MGHLSLLEITFPVGAALHAKKCRENTFQELPEAQVIFFAGIAFVCFVQAGIPADLRLIRYCRSSSKVMKYPFSKRLQIYWSGINRHI